MATTLEDAAAARKAKLLALREKRDGKGKRKAEDELEGPSEPISIVHRNFDASTGQARRHDPTEELDTVEKQVAGLSSQIVADDTLKRQQDLDLFSIQPKKANWDLKRDVEKKLSKLESQTQAAIAQLIRKRLALERAAGKTDTGEKMDDLAAAVESRTAEAISDEED